jgi:ATP-dependent DNA helicase RecG
MLVMTATPIPRTLAITLFGDLDISTIDEMPPGRTPVATRVVGPEGRLKVYQYARQRLEAGEQAYIVAPAIEPGEAPAPTPGLPPGAGPGPAGDVRTLLKWLEEGPLKGLPLAALHGRLRTGTREAVLARFRAGRIAALVSTTVVEVGVDVPNATIMVVEEADRFGLAQLHQLRGRVGRGSKKSLCVYIADAGTPDAQARLAVLAKTSDGFALAEKDLELRGPGELFGTRQSGMPPFRVADLARDLDLLKMARRDAAEWVVKSPMLTRPEEGLLLKRLIKAHGRWLGLGDVG